MKTKIVIKEFEKTGKILHIIKGDPELGAIKLESNEFFNTGKEFITKEKRVTCLIMPLDLAQKLIKSNFFALDKELPIKGKLIVKERLEPFFKGQKGAVHPITEEPLLYKNCIPIYRHTFFSENPDATDELLQDSIQE